MLCLRTHFWRTTPLLVSYTSGPNRQISRFDMILSVKEHEMHHRAQLMLIERVLGITPHLRQQM